MYNKKLNPFVFLMMKRKEKVLLLLFVILFFFHLIVNKFFELFCAVCLIFLPDISEKHTVFESKIHDLVPWSTPHSNASFNVWTVQQV